MPTKTEELLVKEAPIRLDRFLKERFPEISRAYLQSLIRKDLIQVNGKNAKKGAVLHAGDIVRIAAFERPEERKIEPNADIPLRVIWSSDHIAVIDKQAGLPTHPNDFADRNTLANAVLAKFPEVDGVGDDPLRPGIVHRLDTDTSGLLLIARNQNSFLYLRSLFDQREVAKTYAALVLGETEDAGEVNTPVAHHPKNPRKMIAVSEGKTYRSRIREALTIFQKVEFFPGSGLTLLEVQTKTGRMHQVRVHLSSIGHPIVGDRLYQNAKERSSDRTGLKRHFLHACKLSFPEENGNGRLSFDSSLPPELEELIACLQKSQL